MVVEKALTPTSVTYGPVRKEGDRAAPLVAPIDGDAHDRSRAVDRPWASPFTPHGAIRGRPGCGAGRSEEHTSELQSRGHLVCRLLLEKKKEYNTDTKAMTD